MQKLSLKIRKLNIRGLTKYIVNCLNILASLHLNILHSGTKPGQLGQLTAKQGLTEVSNKLSEYS